jgi:hypothetical protein
MLAAQPFDSHSDLRLVNPSQTAMSSLAPPFEITAYASTGRSTQTRSAGA